MAVMRLKSIPRTSWRLWASPSRETEAETSAGLENLNFSVGTSLEEFRRKLMGEYGVAVPSEELPEILRTLGLDSNSELIDDDQQWRAFR